MSKPKLPQLTESIVRAGAEPQSFSRGHELYRSEAISNGAVQGNLLSAHCAGTMEPYYRVTVEFDDMGILNATCTCPYGYGGYCKHIIALLLTYIHKPKAFSPRQSPQELLSALSRDDLLALVQNLLKREPELYDWVQAQIAQPSATTKTKTRKKKVDVQVYRRQVRNVLHSLDSQRASEAYWNVSGVAQGLREIQSSAQKFLDVGDFATARTILITLVQEFAESHVFEYLDDSNGELGSVMDHIGVPLAETFLSGDLSALERARIADQLQGWKKELSDYGADGNLYVAIEAAMYGWDVPSKRTTESTKRATRTDRLWKDDYEPEGDDFEMDEFEDAYDTFTPDTTADLVEAKLNVLARQARIDEYLALCQKEERHLRYALKLCELGRAGEAVKYAFEYLEDAAEALTLAQALRELKQMDDALAVGERGLKMGGDKFMLASWLAPLEQTQGRSKQSLDAWLAAFAERPSLDMYQRIKQLGASKWHKLEPQVLSLLAKSWDKTTLAQILLFEERWDQAIKVAEGRDAHWNGLAELVADALVHERPEWVIQVSKKHASAFIAEKESKYYARAAEWLARAKKAYAYLHQPHEWKTYLNALQEEYKRRPALQAQLKQL